MNNREFLSSMPELIRAYLPQELRSFETRQTGTLVKLYYGDISIHYEVWLQRRTDRIEIGLHFEGEREENHWWLRQLAANFDDIFHRLGPEVEAEEWTAKWTRLHQMVPLTPLNEQRLHDVACRMAQMIEVLHPLVSKAYDEMDG